MFITQKTEEVVVSCTRPVPSFSAVPEKVVLAYADLVSQNNFPYVKPVWVPYQALAVTE